MGAVDEKYLERELRNLTSAYEARSSGLEKAQAYQHGENQKALQSLESSMAQIQRQMAIMVGEGPIDGLIKTMQMSIHSVRTEFQAEIKDVRDDLAGMKRWLLATIAGFLTTVGGIILAYLLRK